jgi:formiminoglutamase
MSDVSSSADAWFTRLEPVQPPADLARRPDDRRLGEVTEFWRGGPAALQPGRPVLIGFPVDEGVRRNNGRTGAAAAPFSIRRWLYHLTPTDCQEGISLADNRLLDLGNLRSVEELEDAQRALGAVVAALLQARAVPIILGGGHETAYGHFLGYVGAGLATGIINIDAHLDVRPCLDGRGSSGTPFRQALEHPSHLLAGEDYVCLGAQPHSVSRHHWDYVHERGGTVRWFDGAPFPLREHFQKEYQRMAEAQKNIYLTVDADAVRAADVPGVSAPNPVGLPGRDVAACVRLAGSLPSVSSLDLVEINPRLDQDDVSARWAAVAVWNFLIGLAVRTWRA